MTSKTSDYIELGVSPDVLGTSFKAWPKLKLMKLLRRLGVNYFSVRHDKIDLIKGIHLLLDYHQIDNNRQVKSGFEWQELIDVQLDPLPVNLDQVLMGQWPSIIRREHPIPGSLQRTPIWTALADGWYSDKDSTSTEDDIFDEITGDEDDTLFGALSINEPISTEEACLLDGLLQHAFFSLGEISQDLFTVPGGMLPVKTFTCTVCLEERVFTDRLESRVTLACKHSLALCKSCVQQSIAIDLDAKALDHIGCPYCGAVLSADDVNRHGDSETAAKYNERIFEQWLNTSCENFQRCRNEGCDYGEQFDGACTSYIICRKCSARTCVSCNTLWHSDLTCAEFQATRSEDPEYQKILEAHTTEERASAKLISESATKCPQCKSPGLKIDGCDHMICPRCQYGYCFQCGADYDRVLREGNTAHSETCEWHPSQLDTTNKYHGTDDVAESDEEENDDEDMEV